MLWWTDYHNHQARVQSHLIFILQKPDLNLLFWNRLSRLCTLIYDHEVSSGAPCLNRTMTSVPSKTENNVCLLFSSGIETIQSTILCVGCLRDDLIRRFYFSSTIGWENGMRVVWQSRDLENKRFYDRRVLLSFIIHPKPWSCCCRNIWPSGILFSLSFCYWFSINWLSFISLEACHRDLVWQACR